MHIKPNVMCTWSAIPHVRVDGGFEDDKGRAVFEGPPGDNTNRLVAQTKRHALADMVLGAAPRRIEVYKVGWRALLQKGHTVATVRRDRSLGQPPLEHLFQHG